MFLFRFLKLCTKVPSSSHFIYRNLFSILKHSLHTIGGDEEILSNFDKIQKDKRLQEQFSKVFYRSYLNNCGTARSRDIQILRRNGHNYRADFMFYTVVFGFIISSVLILFFKHRLSPDGIAIVSAVAGVSGGCLKEVFGFEFGSNDHLSLKSSDYILDECDQIFTGEK